MVESTFENEDLPVVSAAIFESYEEARRWIDSLDGDDYESDTWCRDNEGEMDLISSTDFSYSVIEV